jgi:hypothetical protein
VAFLGYRAVLRGRRHPFRTRGGRDRSVRDAPHLPVGRLHQA